jgi:hypothetical protein
LSYSITVTGENPHELIHRLCIAACEHAAHVSARMIPEGDPKTEGVGVHTITVQADTPEELGPQLAAHAVRYGAHHGYTVEFSDDPSTRPRTGLPPREEPAVTYHPAGT